MCVGVRMCTRVHECMSCLNMNSQAPLQLQQRYLFPRIVTVCHLR